MTSMDVEGLESEAKATAAKHVANMLQRPDQLEKVEQYKRRVSRKKASVESMLKTAMQSQLDGVRMGLVHLLTALTDIKDIKQNLREMEDTFSTTPTLTQRLQDVREESMKHSQYAAAMENLKHIFNVPDSVQKTQDWINDGKLLHAHQCLADLENSRDDLLYELHKLPHQSPTDRNMLKQYFADVEKLSDELGKQLWLILRRTLNSVRKEPQVIVTVLRIIEREERSDAMCIQRHKMSGFMPPGRPKKWRKRAFEVLEEAVQERIEGNQFEGRKDNKMWLARHLEVTRQIILDDLRVVKSTCVPCFPPEYDIVNTYLNMYHENLSRHLQDIILSRLEGNEFITILNWLNMYEGPELLGHPDLDFDVKKLSPLLDNTIVEELVNHYMKTLESNYQEWMKNTLMSDIKDWQKESDPDKDGQNNFHTAVPVIVFQMVDQHLQVARTVNQDLVNRVLILSLKQVGEFTTMYRDAIIIYKNGYFENRNSLKYFTQYMSAIANNCSQFTDNTHRLQQGYWRPGSLDTDQDNIFHRILKMFEQLREEALGFLIDEMFLDLDREIGELMTKKWQLTGSRNIDTICATLDDYHHDYVHLRRRNYDFLINGIEKRIAHGYIVAILQKRMTFKNVDERKQCAQKIVDEAEKLKKTFAHLSSCNKRDSPFDALNQLAEVISLKDASLLTLEISGLIKRYPDISSEQLTALVTLRGDVGRLEARQLVMEILPESGSQQNADVKSIFSDIRI